jgi:nucleoid-associated protein YgaU
MAQEKTPQKPDFSNVKVRFVDSPASARAASGAVVHGDHWRQPLEDREAFPTGDANRWQKIFDANRDQIKDPDLIQPGQKLKIPAAQKSV